MDWTPAAARTFQIFYDKKELADDDCPACAGGRLCFLFHRLVQAKDHPHHQHQPRIWPAVRQQSRPARQSFRSFSVWIRHASPPKSKSSRSPPGRPTKHAARLASGRRHQRRAGESFFLRPAHARTETRSARRAARTAPTRMSPTASSSRPEKPKASTTLKSKPPTENLRRAGSFRFARVNLRSRKMARREMIF